MVPHLESRLDMRSGPEPRGVEVEEDVVPQKGRDNTLSTYTRQDNKGQQHSPRSNHIHKFIALRIDRIVGTNMTSAHFDDDVHCTTGL